MERLFHFLEFMCYKILSQTLQEKLYYGLNCVRTLNLEVPCYAVSDRLVSHCGIYIPTCGIFSKPLKH